jgi:hypothetical protein
VLFTLFPAYIGPIAWCWCAAVWITVGQRTVAARRRFPPE